MRRRTVERRERGGAGEKKTQPLLHHLDSSAFSVSKIPNVIKMEVACRPFMASRLSACLNARILKGVLKRARTHLD